ncbi:MAG: ATP-grasp domain-containing protein [Anaerolineales bacterium]|nr:ATP-grasp domain-containing protein [Anaerolineales bacterium]
MKHHTQPSPNGRHGRVLLLTTPRTYRTAAFLEAAARLGIEAVQALDTPAALAKEWRLELAIDFADVEGATAAIANYAAERPFDAIIAVDDTGSILAAHASEVLNLPHNALVAAEAARNKCRMRQLLHQAGVSSPVFQPFTLADDPQVVSEQVRYPAVVKPVDLSGSRGVIRVNDPAELQAAVARLQKLLRSGQPAAETIYLVEQYIPGVEVALEGLLDNGQLHPLAIFDKPDPLEGPFFEETIYVTPSRLPAETQAAVVACAAQAAQALGLQTGPIHAELRVNEDGPWIVEVAGRSIGGLCSKTLQFGTDASLEELILAQACGLPIESLQRDGRAGGVMMIPIPEAGLLRGVSGCEAAEAVPLIESVEITAQLNYPLVPLPEGESYLGFIFARGDSPAAVEAALREAHEQLTFEISPIIPLKSA